jgi:glycosyltransferase involved in cell wall biosynthesis
LGIPSGNNVKNKNNQMKVLIVANHNKGAFSPFVTEQAEALRQAGVEIDYYGIEGKGITGYLKNRKEYIRKIKSFRPDIIHAHYGLSGLLANLQTAVPVVTTYHGSDINNDKVFRFSKWCIRLSSFNIFVSEKNRTKAGITTNQAVISCGIDTNLFQQRDKQKIRKEIGFTKDEKIILFAGAFDNKVKNPELAQKAVAGIENVKLIELKNYSREQVASLMNAADVLLMTSFTEGSPQVIKEALASGCPIVSVDVGDVKETLEGVAGCFISSYHLPELTAKLQEALHVGTIAGGRERITTLGLDNQSVARKIYTIYKQIMQNLI